MFSFKNKLFFTFALVSDFLLMFAGFFFDFSFFFFHLPGIIILLIITITIFLRRNQRYRKNIFVAIIFIIFVVITLDIMVMINAGLYGWHPLLMTIAPVTYLIALCFRSAKFLQWDRLQTLLIPLLVTFLLSMIGDAPQSEKVCRRISSQQGAKLLINIHSHKISDPRSRYQVKAKVKKKIFPLLLPLPTFLNSYTASKVRYLVKLKNSSKVLLSYRKGFGMPNQTNAAFTLDCFDTKTGQKAPWLRSGEVIGIYQSRRDGDVYAVILNTDSNKEKLVSYMDIVRFDALGNIKHRISMPKGRASYYSASIFPVNNILLIIVENNFYHYNPQTKTIKLLDMKGASFAYSMVLLRHYLYGVNAHSPLFTLLMPSVMKYDLNKNRLMDKRGGGGLFGYYEIKGIPHTQRLIATNLWGCGGVMLDSNLNTISKIKIPCGARTFGIERNGKYLFAPNFFNGYMRGVDIAKNTLLPHTYFIGKGARTVTTDENEKILIGNSCGLVEIDIAKLIEK